MAKELSITDIIRKIECKRALMGIVVSPKNYAKFPNPKP